MNVFIPHRWNNNDYAEISALLDRTKFKVKDYSVPKADPFDFIDKRYNVDPRIKKQIQHAAVVICSNRPAIGGGMAIDEIQYALSIDKPVVAIQVTYSNSTQLLALNVPIIAKRKDSLEAWIKANVK